MGETMFKRKIKADGTLTVETSRIAKWPDMLEELQVTDSQYLQKLEQSDTKSITWTEAIGPADSAAVRPEMMLSNTLQQWNHMMSGYLHSSKQREAHQIRTIYY